MVSAGIAWFVLFLFRKAYIETSLPAFTTPIGDDSKLLTGLIVLPVAWVAYYAFSGFYRNIYRRSRLREFWQTFVSSVTGVLVIFFILLLDDRINTYKDYYLTAGTLFALHFLLTFSGRFILSSITNHRIQIRKFGFNAVLVGSNDKALTLFNELADSKISSGMFFRGFVNVNGESNEQLKEKLPRLGSYKELPDIISKYNITEVVIAVESSEHNKLSQIINIIQNENVFLKMIPDMYSIVMGWVKMNNILGAVLIEVDFEVMPAWQKSAKRVFDILFSIFAIVIGSPIILFALLGILLTDKGPIFFKQERIGFKGKAFKIIKFRTMRVNAEQAGPQLSKEDDPRITKFGKLLRKSRIDEFPQFLNVLKGEMSVVGPRPERQYFIDQIIEKAPHYSRLHRVKPGITSWGQVKFGYAENVDQMVERLKFDILYIENMSIGLDIKIMIYTILIMVQGRGK